MEAHHEVIAFVGCADTGRVVDEITRLCMCSGLKRVVEAPVPVLGAPALRDGLTMFAVFPGAPGWSGILSLNEAFLAERGSNDRTARFVTLCDALGAPGVFREVNAGVDAWSAFDAFGEVTLACDGHGKFSLSGYMWRASAEPDKPSARLNWYGHDLDEANMETVDLSLVEPLLSADREQDMESQPSDIVEARTSAAMARRLAGLRTSRHWREGWPWRLIEDAVRLGGCMPLPDAVILSFAPIDVPFIDDASTLNSHVDSEAEELERRALQGDSESQFQVGLRLRTISGPPYPEHSAISRQRLRAATWFRRSADQGHAAAQYWLGRSHYMNEGASEDWAEAWYWLQLAVAQGQQEAIAWLDEIVSGDETRQQMMQRVLGRTQAAGSL